MQPETPTAPLRASWAAFTAAPHRMFFWSGALYTVVAMVVWTQHQIALHTGWPTPPMWSAPFPLAHGFMMLYAAFDFYIFAFLLTTFPRWLNRDPVPRGLYIPSWALLTAGAHLFWVGLYTAGWLALVGVLLVGAGHALALLACLRVFLAARGEDRLQQVYMLVGLAAGLAGILLTAWELLTNAQWPWLIAREVGLYLFLLQVIFAVVYRMVPFFTTMVTPGMELRRSRWGLHLWCLALYGRAWLAVAGGYHFSPMYGWPLDLLLLLVLANELRTWRFWQANMPHLLRILYLALGWFAVSFAISAGEGLWMWVRGADMRPFGNAALHTLTVGGFGSLLLGISTRVSLGHSGRGLATGSLVNILFLGFQAVPVARVLPELVGFWWLPLASKGYWAGLGWVLVFGVWLLYVAPVLLRPRSDGRPG